MRPDDALPHVDIGDPAAVLREAERRNQLAAKGVRRFVDAPAGVPIATPSEDELREALEKRHEAEGDKLLLALGWEAVRLSEARRTKKTPGVPDRRYYHRRRRAAFWWEVKADAGRQRPDQRAFQEMCEACGEVYVLGKLEALKTWLVAAGYATREGELLIPTPIP
jgi:hypothetical protein